MTPDTTTPDTSTTPDTLDTTTNAHTTTPSTPAIRDTTALRERAYTLHLQGYRSPAIAAHLTVPERTIRSWLASTTHLLNALPALDAPDALAPHTTSDTSDRATTSSLTTGAATPSRTTLTTLQAQRIDAIERHRARSAAAWATIEHLHTTLDPFLARVTERLLLHTEYPDDDAPVSIAALQIAGGPISPAFRAMYQLLPSLISGINRALALAERADHHIDRLLGLSSLPTSSSSTPPATPTPTSTSTPTPPATQPTTQPQTTTPPITATTSRPARDTPGTPAAHEPARRWLTRSEITAAIQAERDAERDAADAAFAARLTEHELLVARAFASLPATLPDNPSALWTLPIDPNAPVTAYRLALAARGSTFLDPDDSDDPDELEPAPPSSNTIGRHSGKQIGNKIGKNSGKNSGNPSGKPTGTPSAAPAPTPRTGVPGAGRDSRRRAAQPSGAPSTTGNPSGKKSAISPATRPATETMPVAQRASCYNENLNAQRSRSKDGIDDYGERSP